MAEKISIPDDVNPKAFFEEIIPKQFEATIAENPPSNDLEGTEFSMQTDVDGPNGGSWAVIIKDGKSIEVKPEAYDKALITLGVKENDWRDTVTGKLGPPMDFTQQVGGDQAKSQLETLKGIHGTLIMEVKKADGYVISTKITFNKAASPETTLKMTLEDSIAMGEGKLDGQQAFMSGKLQIEGDMMFAMQLGSLRMM